MFQLDYKYTFQQGSRYVKQPGNTASALFSKTYNLQLLTVSFAGISDLIVSSHTFS